MALGDFEVKGKLKVVGTTEMTGSIDLNGGALDTVLVTNLNADLMDSAHKDTDGTLSGNSDSSIPTEKAVKTYVDTADALKANDNAVVKLTGGQTVAGVKTFSSQIVGEIDSTDAVRDQGTGAGLLKCKVINIGDWNLQATTTLDLDALITGAGIALVNIRNMAIVLRNDANDKGYPVPWYGNAQQGVVLYTNGSTAYIFAYFYITQGTWTLTKETTGTPDYSDWDATSYNRGWITVWYAA